MTEEEFKEKVKYIMVHYGYSEQTAIDALNMVNAINEGMRRGEFYSLSASTPPEKSVFHNTYSNSATPENKVASMKLFIFDYYNNLKPGMVFAYNQEEAIAMIKEAGITGQPDKFYSSAKEIEIPVDPTYVRYNSGE